MASSLALGCGRATLEPFALSSFDMQTRPGRDDARSYIRNEDPGLLLISFPIEPCRKQRQTSRGRPYQARRSLRQCGQRLTILALIQDVTEWQAERGRVVIVEHPFGSMAWNTAPMRRLRSHPLTCEALLRLHPLTHEAPLEPRASASGSSVKAERTLVVTQQVLEAVTQAPDELGTHDRARRRKEVHHSCTRPSRAALASACSITILPSSRRRTSRAPSMMQRIILLGPRRRTNRVWSTMSW